MWIEENFKENIDWENIMQMDKKHDYSASSIGEESDGSGIAQSVDQDVMLSPLYSE